MLKHLSGTKYTEESVFWKKVPLLMAATLNSFLENKL